MKIPQSTVVVCLLAVMLAVCLPLIKVFAQDDTMTDQQIQLIRENCTSAENTLNQLHSSDALLRVNMGEMYEAMSAKLMDGFNGRVSNNHFNNSSLVGVMNTYNSTLDTFRSDYMTYEQQLSAALGIDCIKEPVSFYDAVSSARTDRDTVHADIIKLNQNIDSYDWEVSQFEKDYQLAADGVKQ
jgi:hypothetical protein